SPPDLCSDEQAACSLGAEAIKAIDRYAFDAGADCATATRARVRHGSAVGESVLPRAMGGCAAEANCRVSMGAARRAAAGVCIAGYAAERIREAVPHDCRGVLRSRC